MAVHGLSWALALGQCGALRATQGGVVVCARRERRGFGALSLWSLIADLSVSVMPLVSALNSRFFENGPYRLSPRPPFLWSVWNCAGCVLCVTGR